MRIAVDFDETLIDLMSIVCDALNSRYGRTITPKDVRTWSFEDKPCGYTDEDFLAAVDEVIGRKAFAETQYHGKYWLQPPVDSMARWYFNYLTANHAVDIVSKRPTEDAPLVADWLRRNRFAGWRGIVCVEHMADKANLPYDIWVDDSPKLAEAMPPGKRLILYSRPWNRSVRLKAGQVRAHQWSEVVDLVEFLG